MRRISGKIFDSSSRRNTSDAGKHEKRLLPLQRLGRIEQPDLLGVVRELHERIVGNERLALPVLVLGLEVELDDRLRKQLALGEVRIALQIGAVRLAPHHHLVGQHVALGRDERHRAVLLDEGDRQTAGLEQAEDVAGGRGGEPPLVRDDVVLGAVAGRDVVLGDNGRQLGTAVDQMDLLGLALGDQGAEDRGCFAVNAF